MLPSTLVRVLAIGCLLLTAGCGARSGDSTANNGAENNGVNNGGPNNGGPNNGDPNNGDPNNGDPNNGMGGLTAPALPSTPGDHTLEVSWEAADRTVVVSVPASYVPETAAPLLVVLHGGGSDAVSFRDKRAGFVEGAAALGWISVFPEGTPQRDGDGRSWNAWDKPGTSADDVAFLDQLLDWLVAGLHVDVNRVYLAGFSNGAAMTQRFVAERPERILGAFALSHTTRLVLPTMRQGLLCGDCMEYCDPDACPLVVEGDTYDLPSPAGGVNLLVARGGADETVCASSGCSNKRQAHATAEEQRQFWIEGMGCDAEPVVDEERPRGVTRKRYEGCDGDTVFQAIFDLDLDHTWPDEYDAPALMFLNSL